jgi:hypothetical protein
MLKLIGKIVKLLLLLIKLICIGGITIFMFYGLYLILKK